MIFQTEINILTLLSLATFSETSENDTLTFTIGDSFVKLVGYEGSYNMNLSMEIRTWLEEGVLVFHKFSSKGHLKIFLAEGKLIAEIVCSEEGSSVHTLEHYDTVVSDGRWQHLQFFISQTLVGLSINNHTVTASLPSLIRTGGNTWAAMFS